MVFLSSGMEVPGALKTCLPGLHEDKTRGDVRADNFQTPDSLLEVIANEIPEYLDWQYRVCEGMSSKIRLAPARFLQPTTKVQAPALDFGILRLLELVVDLTIHVMGS